MKHHVPHPEPVVLPAPVVVQSSVFIQINTPLQDDISTGREHCCCVPDATQSCCEWRNVKLQLQLVSLKKKTTKCTLFHHKVEFTTALPEVTSVLTKRDSSVLSEYNTSVQLKAFFSGGIWFLKGWFWVREKGTVGPLCTFGGRT